MNCLFRSFSFAFFPEDPSTIGIRVTWNKHQKLVRSPHSSRTSFSHWMQKACSQAFHPHNLITTSPHRTWIFHYIRGISGNFWSEKTHWVTAVLSSTKSNMPTANMPDVVLQGLRPISKMDRPFCLLEFSLGETLMLGFLMGFLSMFCQSPGKPVHHKKKSTQETLAFRVGFLWSGWSEGWTMATCFMPWIKKVTLS